MRFSSLASAAILAFTAFATPAFADDASDRSDAIALCRAEIAGRAGVEPDQIRLDTVRTRPRVIRVDLDVWSAGSLQNVRCEVSRGEALVIASINPPVGAQASN